MGCDCSTVLCGLVMRVEASHLPGRLGILYSACRTGRLAQLARAPRLHRGCRGFESLIAHLAESISRASRLELDCFQPS